MWPAGAPFAHDAPRPFDSIPLVRFYARDVAESSVIPRLGRSQHARTEDPGMVGTSGLRGGAAQAGGVVRSHQSGPRGVVSTLRMGW